MNTNIKSSFPNSTAYIISAGNRIEPVAIIKYSGGFYTVRYQNREGGTRLKEHRLFVSEEEAKQEMTGRTNSLKINKYRK